MDLHLNLTLISQDMKIKNNLMYNTHDGWMLHMGVPSWHNQDTWGDGQTCQSISELLLA